MSTRFVAPGAPKLAVSQPKIAFAKVAFSETASAENAKVGVALAKIDGVGNKISESAIAENTRAEIAFSELSKDVAPAKIVFTTFGSFGDVHPYLAIGRELSARGHRVVVATCELYRGAVENAGLEFFAVRPDLPDPETNDEFYARVMDPVRGGARYLLENVVAPSVRETFADLQNATRDADIFVSHSMAVVAPLVAATFGETHLRTSSTRNLKSEGEQSPQTENSHFANVEAEKLHFTDVKNGESSTRNPSADSKAQNSVQNVDLPRDEIRNLNAHNSIENVNSQIANDVNEAQSSLQIENSRNDQTSDLHENSHFANAENGESSTRSAQNHREKTLQSEAESPDSRMQSAIPTRWISAIVSPMFLQSVSDPPSLPILPQLARVPILGDFLVRRWNRFLAKWLASPLDSLRELRRELGLPPAISPLFADAHSPHRVLGLFSPALAPPQNDWPKQARAVGFCLYDRNLGAKIDDELQKFLDESARPPILFTLGASSALNAGDFWTESLEAVRLLNCRAIFVVGRDAKSWPEELSSRVLPDVLRVSYVPLSSVLPRCESIVHHGGIGTISLALQAGKPMLIMPHSQDQPDNALRAARCGVARLVTRRQYKAARVADELRLLSSTRSYVERAQKLALQLENERGTQTACDFIEDELRQMRAQT